ncbi:leucine-rich repeat receptor-like protein kinase PXC2 [Vicia villosa]|uniref:leucine-rich repeat receptor-like protein kinase PXC2 n=1 Tax=Vicia villosa TaxID=3911 RepID=UPI00273C6274|nr:leucine-rich repeat receptor-like protein kinase PXC2 [Vicia villosa]
MQAQFIIIILSLFLVLFVPFQVISLYQPFNEDMLGLIVFKSGLEDPKNKLSSWNEDDYSPCNWEGVKCDPITNRVSSLVLDGFSLSGHIGKSLMKLQFLQILSLSRNNFTGKINHDLLVTLWNLKVVDLSENSLSGTIPDELFQQCWSLRVLSFAKNNLTGKIPESLSSCYSLASLNFSSNQLNGELHSGMWFLKELQSLDLSNNFLKGEIPEGVQNLYDLRELRLGRNFFTGRIPENIGNCLLLKMIDFGDNLLTDEIPESIQRLTSCTLLNLQGNFLNGSIPHWIGELNNLEILDLSSNRFLGSIPSGIGGLRSLQVLNLSTNNIFGSIPASIKELKSLYVLDLSDNKLNGSIPLEIEGTVSLIELKLQRNLLGGRIPVQIAKCSALKSLNLAHNNLIGSIPATIANLTNLQSADLSWNKLSGTLPKKLTNLTHLSSFNVSYNHLQGELPIGGFFNTITPSFVHGNPLLCGSVVNHSCDRSYHPKPIVLNPNSNYNSSRTSLQNHHHKIMLSISVFIAIGAAVSIVVGVVAVTVLNIHVRSSVSHSGSPFGLSGGEDNSFLPEKDPKCGKFVMINGDDVEFSDEVNNLLKEGNEIGRGGFGVVYCVVLRDQNFVAIKKLLGSSMTKSQEEFEREVQKLGKIRHQNLVGLEGYYWNSSFQLIIYEYFSRGSLHKLLHDDDDQSKIEFSWRARFKVILGIAKGLAYLHQMNIIHYNLKSTNVFIDICDEPKIGDFSLVNLLPILDHCVLSSKIQSALGYTAPEFACRTVNITEKCDVYGFGILVLEIVSGKRPVEYMEDDVVVLCDMVRSSLEDGKVEQCIDEKLVGYFSPEEAIPVIKLGLVCASQVPSSRPDMANVVNILETIQCSSEGQQEEIQ